jgi:hypothetical protein
VYGTNGKPITGPGNELFVFATTVLTKDSVVLGDGGSVTMPVFGDGHAETGIQEEGRMVSAVYLTDASANQIPVTVLVLNNDTLEPTGESFPVGAYCGLKTVGLYMGVPPTEPPPSVPPNHTGQGPTEIILMGAGAVMLLLVAGLFAWAGITQISTAKKKR